MCCDAPAWFALCSDIKERELKSNHVIILPDFSNFHWPLNGGATLYGVSLIRDHYEFRDLEIFARPLHFFKARSSMLVSDTEALFPLLGDQITFIHVALRARYNDL